MIGGPPMVAFHFSPSRSQDVAQLLLGDYSGTIIRDSYVGYENLSCEAACCWSHMRRRVFDAHKAGFVKSARMLDMIRDLYRLERIAKDKAEAKGSETALFQARKTVRRESQKIVDNIFALCREWQHNELPSSPLANGDSVFLRGDLQSQWRQLPSMAGRHFDPHQYHASITDRLFAPSKLGSSTHVEISRESHANAPLSDFNGNPSSLAGQRRKIRPEDEKSVLTHSKAKKHDQKFCSPDFWHGGDWGDTCGKLFFIASGSAERPR